MKKSISDDDLCSRCQLCNYRPGELSSCRMLFPGIEDEDGYIVDCPNFSSTDAKTEAPP